MPLRIRHRFSSSLLTLISALGVTLVLGACGKKDEPPAAPRPEKAPAAAPAPQAKTKVAFIYIGPVGDGGWTFAHDQARKTVQAELNDKIETSYVESVPESADAERILRDKAQDGNKLIFATSFGYMDYVQRVAADFPDVRFEHATGYKTSANSRIYDSRTYEGAYLAGIVAGGMTRSNTLGVVGSVPIPEVIRNINSFTLGAQSVNPDIKTKVVWVNDWFSPPKETEAATALINGGADILFQNTDSAAVLKTAEERGIRALGWDSDMTAYGPKAHLGSAVINWAPYYRKSINDVLNNTWHTADAWWGVKEGAIDLVSLAADVPEELKAQVQAAKTGLKDGTHSIWKGPIVDNTGKEVLAAGVTADDAFLRSIHFFVKGVEGAVPGAK